MGGNGGDDRVADAGGQRWSIGCSPLFLGGLSGVGGYRQGMHPIMRAEAPTPFLSGRRMVEDAKALAREFGEDALYAASLRAARSRARDNALAWCHWREVERLVGWMVGSESDGDGHLTRH
jgi:hypothetical protein